MNTGFDENQAEFGVFVATVLFHVFADRDSLLDEVVQVFWDFRGEALGLQDAEDLVTREAANVGDTLGVTQADTDFGWGQALLCQLVDLVFDIISRVQVSEPL